MSVYSCHLKKIKNRTSLYCVSLFSRKMEFKNKPLFLVHHQILVFCFFFFLKLNIKNILSLF